MFTTIVPSVMRSIFGCSQQLFLLLCVQFLYIQLFKNVGSDDLQPTEHVFDILFIICRFKEHKLILEKYCHNELRSTVSFLLSHQLIIGTIITFSFKFPQAFNTVSILYLQWNLQFWIDAAGYFSEFFPLIFSPLITHYSSVGRGCQ